MLSFLTKIKQWTQNINLNDDLEPINFHNDMSNRVNRLNIILMVLFDDKNNKINLNNYTIK